MDYISNILSNAGAQLIAERFYAHVYRAPSMIVKVIAGHKVLLPEGFPTKSEASNFGAEVYKYMEKLEALGVPIPSIAQTNLSIVSHQGTGKPIVIIVTPDGGESYEHLFEQCELRDLYNLAAAMVNAFLPALVQKRLTDGYPEIGIDPIPSNFTKTQDGRIMYIDFTPPRYFSPDRGYRIEYPQPTDEAELSEGRWRYYEPHGILTRWLTDCCRVRPDGRNIFLTVLSEMLPKKLWKFIQKHLYSLRMSHSCTTVEWQEAIQSACHAIDLRDLACALASEAREDLICLKTWLNEFFVLSRHHPGEMIPAERLEILRSVLFSKLQ